MNIGPVQIQTMYPHPIHDQQKLSTDIHNPQTSKALLTAPQVTVHQ